MRFSLTQIQTIVEISRSDFHVSKAANRLNTSQSVVSKHLKSFEDAFEGRVFIRSGKRLTGLTPEGSRILEYAERMLRDHRNIERIGRETNSPESQVFSLATTPTLARYLLADTVKTFTLSHPDVHLHVQVEESDKAVEVVQLGQCDLAIVPIGRNIPTSLEITHLTRWTRLLIGLADCELFRTDKLTLEKIATEPLISFETPTVSLQEVFKQADLMPEIALTTSNPEVMKAYAMLGLGVAIVAAPTYDAKRDAPLQNRDVSGLFPDVRIGAVMRKDTYRSDLQNRFLEYLAANLRTLSS